MKNLIIAATSAFILSGTAYAADLAPIIDPAPAAYDWTGIHIGAHVGYGWSSNDWTRIQNASGTEFGPGGEDSHDADGFLGGIQAGYTHQFNQFVLGVEGDISWTGMDGIDTWDAGGGGGYRDVTADYNWVGTLAVRGGIAFDRTLLYLKAGGAVASVEYGHTGNNNNFASTDTRTGWLVGAGAEHAFTEKWSVKAEYNYIDFGTEAIAMENVGAGPSPAIYSVNSKAHILNVGLNFRF